MHVIQSNIPTELHAIDMINNDVRLQLSGEIWGLCRYFLGAPLHKRRMKITQWSEIHLQLANSIATQKEQENNLFKQNKLL